MNRTELTHRISEQVGISRHDADRAIKALVNAITLAGRGNDSVRITGFGTFRPRNRKARIGRNPQTGAKVRIPASRGISFSPGATLKLHLNSHGPLPEVTVTAAATPAKKAAPKKAAAKKAPARKAAAKKAPARKAAARKAPARKAAAKRAPARKAPARKAAAKKAPARKAAARKAPARKAPARKAAAKKAPARKAAAKRAPARKAPARKAAAKRAPARRAR